MGLHNGIVVVIPAYNEERFIGSVALKARQQAEVVIVVDDGSTDCTAEVAQVSGAVVIKHNQNLGKGCAVNTGFRVALKYSPKVVVLMDADGQHLPEQMQALVKPVLEGRADIVIGSRYIRLTSQVPLQRVWGHRAFNWLTWLASGVASTDSQSGYRAFSPTAVESIVFKSQGFAVETEMQFITHELKLRLIEVPITIQYQDKPKRSAWGQGMSVLNEMLKLTGQYRPLLSIGLPGLMMLLIGIGLGLFVVERFDQGHVLAVGHAIACMLISISGLITLSTGVILHSVRGFFQDFLVSQMKNTGQKSM